MTARCQRGGRVAGLVRVERESIRSDDDYASLAGRLERVGGELLVRALDELPAFVEQPEAGVTYAEKLEATDRTLDPGEAAAVLERTVRALRPHIGARIALPSDAEFLGVVRARVLEAGGGSGEEPGWVRVDDEGRLRLEIRSVEQDLQDLLRNTGDGAGNDQADVGSTTLERDAEMSLANNTREMLFQVQRALGRLDDGTYGVCESCGNPIGKQRLMAFPRATLCMTCKQREERR